jgi:pSer/pThr/pTyr-binding forkhead associated (FHA) protein
VSRTHALLLANDGRLSLRDLNSSNGTYVNGTRVMAETELADGDRITIGESELHVRILPPPDLSSETIRVPVAAPPRVAAVTGAAAAAPLDPSEPAEPKTKVGPPPGGDAAPAPDLLPSIAGAAALGDRPRTQVTTKKEFLPAAGFWLRLLAFALDGLWMAAVAVAASFAAGGPTTNRGILIESGVALALGLAVPLVGWSRWGTTPGKRLFRLFVCPVEGGVRIPFGRALLRLIGYALSSALFCLGFVMIGLSSSKRGLHDLIASTYVGRRRS